MGNIFFKNSLVLCRKHKLLNFASGLILSALGISALQASNINHIVWIYVLLIAPAIIVQALIFMLNTGIG
jgi:hypothetical protein